MMIKVFELNKNHKIEFTKEELEELLEEAYNQGYVDGQQSRYWIWHSPTITTPTWDWTKVTCNGNGTNQPYPDDKITYTTTAASSNDPSSNVTISVGSYPKNDEVTIN